MSAEEDPCCLKCWGELFGEQNRENIAKYHAARHGDDWPEKCPRLECCCCGKTKAIVGFLGATTTRRSKPEDGDR